jgi:DNA-directed RNA polymerase I, II, and III subunit RPABC2
MNKEEEMEIENNDNKNLITKDKAIFIPIKDRLTSRFLTKYERAKIIGERAIQINNGSEVYVEIPNGVWDSLKIAEKELKEKKIPYVIRRYLPNGDFEDWELNELIFD